MFAVEWKHNSKSDVDRYRVVATPHTANGAGTVTVQANDPNCECGEIELLLGTTYSVSVQTYFKGSNHPYNSEDVQLTTPTEEKGNT